MITKELLKEYMVDWLENYPNVVYKSRYELAEYLVDKIWKKLYRDKAPAEWFDHAP